MSQPRKAPSAVNTTHLVFGPKRYLAPTFYLGSVVGRRFLLRRRNIDEAYHLMREAVVSDASRRKDATLRAVRNIDDFFRWNAMVPIYDRAKNVVDFDRHGGDLWVDWMLRPAAHLVEDGSFFLVKGDDGNHWKMCFEAAEVFWVKEKKKTVKKGAAC